MKVLQAVHGVNYIKLHQNLCGIECACKEQIGDLEISSSKTTVTLIDNQVTY